MTPSPAGATGGTVNPLVRISPLFEALLVCADGLLTRAHQSSAAVLVAQTAIEVCTQRLITKLLVNERPSFSKIGLTAVCRTTTSGTKRWRPE